MNNENINEPQNNSKNSTILNQIIKWCIYLFIFLLPLWFLPFTNDVLGLNKQVLMIGLLTTALIAWLGELLTKEKFNWYKGPIVIAFLAFVIIYSLSTIFSIQPYHSLMGPDNHLSRALINVIYFFIFFILMINYKAEEKEKRSAEIIRFLTIFLGSSIIVGIIGFLQILGIYIFPGAFTKLGSFNTVGTTTGLGIFMAVLIPVALSLLISIKTGEGKKERTITTGLKTGLTLLIVLALIIILLLNYRILWIATAIGMVIIAGFWLAKRSVLQSHNRSLLAAPITILAFCLIFILFRPGALFNLNLPIELGLSPNGSWNVVKETIKNNPILGTGPETFVYNYSLYKPQNVNQTIFWNIRFTNAHSEIFSLLSEIGILGILALLAIIAIFLWKIIKDIVNVETNSGQLSEIKIGLFSGWLALLTTWFLYPQSLALIFVFWLFLAFLTVMSSTEKEIKIINRNASGKIALITSFGFIILIVAIVSPLYLEGSKFIAEINYQNGLNLINQGELDAGINKIIQATITNPREDKFYRNLAQLFLSQINQNLNNQDLTTEDKASRVQAAIGNALNSSLRATVLDSKSTANWIVRGSVYRNLMPLIKGSDTWALKSYEEALKLEPNNPFVYTEIARTHIGGADLDKAIEAYNQAIKSKPNYSPAHFELALVYDRQGKTSEAIAKMENSKILAPKDIGVAFQLGVLYYKSSQFDKAKTEFKRAVALDENYSNARYFLGLLLDKAGNKQEAIDQFEKIAQLNPDNDTVKQILANLKEGKPALGSEAGIPQQPQQIPMEEGQPEELKTLLPDSE